MSAETADRRRKDGVEFIYEDDGKITARDIESDVASYGETKAEALAMLSEALELHAGGGDPVTDEDLREWGIDPDDVPDGPQVPETPWFDTDADDTDNEHDG